jgi:pilus assembly protein CpaB
VTRGARRRRGALLLTLAVACGGVAASEVENRERRLDARIGPLVPVVVARSDLPQGASIAPGRIGGLLAVRRVPARFAPPDSLAAPAEAAGARLAVPLAAGAYVTGAALARGGGDSRSGRRAGVGERAVDVAVAAGTDLADAGPGIRVDVLITTDGQEGRGRSYLALEDVELLSARPGGQAAAGAGGGAGAHATAVATLRVTLREAVLLTAAESFAREIRLLVRPPGERRAGARVAIDAAAL